VTRSHVGDRMTWLQLAVLYNDNTTMYYPVNPDRPWRVDAATRCLVIGHGVPRTHVPLDQVRSFGIEHVDPEPVTADRVRCPSCDRLTMVHGAEGCWRTTYAADRHALCPCELPRGGADDD
jgi:hypothetical protein